MRCLHELGYHDNASFVTLTYSDNNLPDNGSLVKADLQKFVKRLRKNIGDRRIKYFAAGEYGDSTNRPHYHAILFGVGLSEEDKMIVMASWPFCDWTQPSIRKKSFGAAEADSIRYVCQYIDKKYTGELEYEMYTRHGLVPPFRLLSQGIGERYAIDNRKQIDELGYITVKGIKNSIPRYYINKLDLDVDKLRKAAQELDCEVNEHYSGINISSADVKASMQPELIQSIYVGQINSRKQSERNLAAKTMLKQSKL